MTVDNGYSVWHCRRYEVYGETYKLYRRAVHCEGRVFSTLFGLLFWDIIFLYVFLFGRYCCSKKN